MGRASDARAGLIVISPMVDIVPAFAGRGESDQGWINIRLTRSVTAWRFRIGPIIVCGREKVSA
jgi:hypothetical protein